MLTFEERQAFYQTSQLHLKDNPQWRLFKIQLEDGIWKTINNQIRDEEQLRKILIEYSPINVFSSCSAWLNPLKIEHPSYKYADALFLYNDVFIDMDNKDKQLFNDTVNWFSNTDRFELRRGVDSGNGFHQYYQDNKKIIERDPIKRYKLVQKEREELAEYLRDSELDVDFEMTRDLTRISRVVGTLNDGTEPCTLLYDPRMGVGSERLIADEGKQIHRRILEGMREPDQARPSTFNYWYWNYIDTYVEGTKLKDKRGKLCGRYCIFIKKDKSLVDITKFINKLKFLQNLYKLPEFYIFETWNTYEAICPEAHQYKRVLKILKQIKSKNYNSFQKYHHYWIRTSNILDINKSVVDDKPRFIDRLDSEFEGNFFSKPHYNYLISFLEKIGKKPKKTKNLLMGNDHNITKTTFSKIPTTQNGHR